MHLTPGAGFVPGDTGILNDTVAYWTSGLAGCGVRRPGQPGAPPPHVNPWREPSLRPSTNQTRESFTVANIKSQMKRIKTNEKARQRNKAIKSELRTHVRNFRTAVAEGDKAKAVELSRVANRALDKAVTKGVIHANQAANRKSAISLTVNTLD